MIRGCFVLFDLDDVMANLRTGLQTALFGKTALDVPVESWTKWDITEIYQISHKELLDVIIDQSLLEMAAIEDGVHEILEMAGDLGLKTGIVTARGWHPNGHTVTQEWLSKKNIRVDDLVLVNHAQKKSDVLARYEHVHLFVDDHVKNLDDMAATGRVEHILLFDRPWNRHDSRYDRVHHLSDVGDRLVSTTPAPCR